MAKTQKIPVWSANLSANGPKDWQAALGRTAFKLGISSGELLRQLLMAGALAKFPELGRKLVAAHRRYYPARPILATALLMGTLCAGLLFQALTAKQDGRRVRLSYRTAVTRNLRWEGAAAA